MRDRAVAAYMHQPTGRPGQHAPAPRGPLRPRRRPQLLPLDGRRAGPGHPDLRPADQGGQVGRQGGRPGPRRRPAPAAGRRQPAAGSSTRSSPTLQLVESASKQQAATQAQLLLQVGQERRQVRRRAGPAQVAESANIEQLLASTGSPGATPQAPTGGGFFSPPDPRRADHPAVRAQPRPVHRGVRVPSRRGLRRADRHPDPRRRRRRWSSSPAWRAATATTHASTTATASPPATATRA